MSGSVKQGASDVIVRHFDNRSFQHSRNGDMIGGIFGHPSSVTRQHSQNLYTCYFFIRIIFIRIKAQISKKLG